MKMILFLVIILNTTSAFAATIKCEAAGHAVIIQTSGNDIRISYKGESTLAEGLVNSEEVDLVARFPTFGEITIYARVGQRTPADYMFINGQRISVSCR